MLSNDSALKHALTTIQHVKIISGFALVMIVLVRKSSLFSPRKHAFVQFVDNYDVLELRMVTNDSARIDQYTTL